jgi:uncharacterized protein
VCHHFEEVTARIAKRTTAIRPWTRSRFRKAFSVSRHLSERLAQGVMEGLDEADIHDMVGAALDGDLVELQRLVQQDRRLLDANTGGFTPLVAATVEGHVGAVRYLLDEGADINLPYPRLNVACSEGRQGIVALLLACSTEVMPDEGGMAPLMSVSYEGFTELLLADGGVTALHIACMKRLPNVARVLLGAGADPLVECTEGLTPWLIASLLDKADCVALLEVGHVPMSHTCTIILPLRLLRLWAHR